jgi:hypothetical protein
MAVKILDGNGVLKPAWSRFGYQIYVFQQYEINSLVKTIELLPMFGERILEFYVQNSSG